MALPTKCNLKIYQGATFGQVFRWESATKIYKNITSISKAAPTVVGAVAHGLVVGWRAKITNVLGMKEINSQDYRIVTAVTTDTATFNELNSLDYTTYTSGGVLEYNQPNILTGVTARMQIREKLSSTVVIQDLTTENGMIVIDTIKNTITISISAILTSSYTFNSAVYSIELINGTVITPFVYGDITLVKEITR